MGAHQIDFHVGMYLEFIARVAHQFSAKRLSEPYVKDTHEFLAVNASKAKITVVKVLFRF
jgi:hypothetical protein